MLKHSLNSVLTSLTTVFTHSKYAPFPTPLCCRLWLESDLGHGSCSFASGEAFGARKDFSVMRIEVWGCGSADDLSKQEKERLRDHQAAEHRQKVRYRALFESR